MAQTEVKDHLKKQFELFSTQRNIKSVVVPVEKITLPDNNLPGLSNFAKVTDVLYRGAQPLPEGFVTLKKMGIKTIIDLRAFHSDIADDKLEGLGLYYYRVHINTWHIEEQDIFKVFKVILNPDYFPIFVHCEHGSDRTGLIIAIYRTVFCGWPIADAITEMRNFGFHEIWENIENYLQDFHTDTFIEQLKTAPEPKVKFVR
jgi:protein tyrosine/serine phosphatase